MWQNERCLDQEILDLDPFAYGVPAYHHCLRTLGRVNRVLLGFQASRWAFRQLPAPPKSILDVGCGGGQACWDLHRLYPQAQITGIDLNPEALHVANSLGCSPLVHFQQQTEARLDYEPNRFDVVHSMLVCHHMTDEEMVTFLQQALKTAAQAVIVNDLQRHLLAYLGFTVMAPVLFPSYMIWHDGRLSIRRSFRRDDWFRLIKRAQIPRQACDLHWHPFFRWTLTVRKNAI